MSDSDTVAHQYHALSSGCGFVELANWSTITLAGDDRASFLHNMCTNDINGMAVGDCCEAFCTDVKGKIVGHVLVTSCADRLVLLAVPDQADTLISHLDRYIIREDVQLADATADYDWFAALPGDTRTTWGDREGIPYVSSNADGIRAASLIGVATADRQRTRDSLIEHGIEQCSAAAWELLRIEDRFPLFGTDFDTSNLPQEVNRDDHAISFTKGCYLGQETIARIDALGHVNQKLVALQFAGDTVPPPGTELRRDDKVVGRVTSSCRSPKYDAPLATAMIRRGANDEGTELQSELGPATVIGDA